MQGVRVIVLELLSSSSMIKATVAALSEREKSETYKETNVFELKLYWLGAVV